MPSSSTHSTTVETTLHACWRLAFIRMDSVRYVQYAGAITRAFAYALDVTAKDLLGCTWPPGPDGKNGEVATEEWARHKAIQSMGLKLNEAQMVEGASEALMEARDVLVQAGREGEGEKMGGMGKQLHELAISIAKGGGYYNGEEEIESEFESESDSVMTDVEGAPSK